MQSGNQNFQIQQLEANILRDKGGNAIKSFINEQANHISDLTYKLDLDGKGIDISKSSISEKEIVIVVGEQLIIPDRVDLVSNEEEQSLLVTLLRILYSNKKRGFTHCHWILKKQMVNGHPVKPQNNFLNQT